MFLCKHFCDRTVAWMGWDGVGRSKVEVMVSGLWEKSVAALMVEECGVKKTFVTVFAKKTLQENTKKTQRGMVRK
jgi:hypothetical protein